MSEREAALQQLGVYLGSGATGNDALRARIDGDGRSPLSAFGEFTPISVRSYTVMKTENADLERDH